MGPRTGSASHGGASGQRARAVLAIGLVVVAASCAPAREDSAVEPLAAAPTTTDRVPRPSASTTTADRSSGAIHSTVPTTAATGGTEDLRSQVDRVLERYAHALTDLAVDPERRTRPGTPQRAAWDRTVLTGSPLSADLLDSLVRRHREERRVVRPGPSGLAYRHHPLLVEPPLDGTISFTWCGWSPGIGIDADDGTVLDDAVAHSHGTGQLRLVEGHWMLELLDELDLAVLPPGSPDPCPAEVEEAAR